MDPRIEKTKKRIRDSLINLSAKKPYPDISVKELCTKAGVNRTSFYAHYRNTRDVLNDIEARAVTGTDWYNSLEKSQRKETLLYLKQHKEEFALLVDYGNVRQLIIRNSYEKNRKFYQDEKRQFSEDDLMVATILTVSGILDAFRFMIAHDMDFDMDRILNHMIILSNHRYKELLNSQKEND